MNNQSIDITTQIKALLEAYFDESDPAALSEACKLASHRAMDMVELLRWLQEDAIAEDEMLTIATRQIRRAMGLQMIPGAVCQPTPKA
jgi:hypothetical protein